jgi:DNA-binding NtrC family response regulator
MPGDSGLDVVRHLSDTDPDLPVLVMTGHGSVPSAVECLRAGARDYLQKPVDPEALVLVLDRAIAETGRERELGYLRSIQGRSGEGSTGGPLAAASDPALVDPGLGRRPLGISESWLRVVELAEVAAPTDVPVLLTGESGTGKEEIAQLIHRLSPRSSGPFVQVNCAAIPVELFESEFFGHRKGAFTGATADRVGRFKVADRGTLFLDEIDSLAAVSQAKVLRVLQDGRFERLGDSRPSSSDVRLISASNADLAAEVEAGAFRADLFYRLNVMTLEIPPLRQRPEDVPVLAEAFLIDAARRLGRPIDDLAPETVDALLAYPWPGNVRELKNVIERGVLLERSNLLTPDSLPPDVAHAQPAEAPRTEHPPGTTLRERLLEEEKRILEGALERSGGVRRRAAEELGIDERNLPYFLKKHGLG